MKKIKRAIQEYVGDEVKVELTEDCDVFLYGPETKISIEFDMSLDDYVIKGDRIIFSQISDIIQILESYSEYELES